MGQFLAMPVPFEINTGENFDSEISVESSTISFQYKTFLLVTLIILQRQ